MLHNYTNCLIFIQNSFLGIGKRHGKVIREVLFWNLVEFHIFAFVLVSAYLHGGTRESRESRELYPQL